MQLSYDAKLNDATSDAIKAFQLNTVNNDTSDLANSKLRDIEASANTFFTSVANNFNMVGYNKDILKDFVPALVYTMYDGYYIYSPYTNKLDSRTKNEVIINETTGETAELTDAEILKKSNSDATYHEGDEISGLKPYIHYSCRYKAGYIDVIITYTLDNYITVQGTINGQYVDKSGYLLDNIVITGSQVTYRGVEIKQNEQLEEYIYNPDNDKREKFQYVKVNGVKYYKDSSGSYFSILNDRKYPQNNFNPINNNAAIKYYKDALQFSQWVKTNLGSLSTANAVDGNFGNHPIFDFGGSSTSDGSIEDPNSYFNQHRLQVIKYAIEKNLSIAIANYNNYSGASANFQMPNLKETEWESIINNVSLISFLQGLSIGGKIYNGYSIITNNKTKEVVQEDSIYILTGDNKYHKVNDSDLISTYNTDSSINGYLYMDFEIKSAKDGEIYYMPKMGTAPNYVTGCYGSIIDKTSISYDDDCVDNGIFNFYKYIEKIKNQNQFLASAYFTALGRERYGLYRSNNNSEKAKAEFLT